MFRGLEHIQGKAERSGTAQPRKDGEQILSMLIKYKGQVPREWEQALFGDTLLREKRQQTEIVMQEILSEYAKNLLYFEDDKAQEQAAQRDHAGSFCGDIQNPCGHFPVQSTLKNLLSQGGWTR